MEAGIFFPVSPIPWSPNFNSTFCPVHRSFSRIIRVSSSSSSRSPGSYRGPKPSSDWAADWVSNNDDTVRSLPIYVGGVSLFAVLFNRAVSGIAPVADASSSQSRADLLTLGLAVTNILAGLVWLSIRPKSITPVNPLGVACERISSSLPDLVTSELLWAWKSLSEVTCCRSLVVVYDAICIFQVGFAAESTERDGEAEHVEAIKLMEGSLYQGILKSQAQSYLANLSLYPGKSQLPFLPSNTQIAFGIVRISMSYFSPSNPSAYFTSLHVWRAVILQPLGEKGIAIIGGNTIRGFTASDQAWISLVGEKLDATLLKYSNNFQPTVKLNSKGELNC